VEGLGKEKRENAVEKSISREFQDWLWSCYCFFDLFLMDTGLAL
jgi:hypothetical protein